MNILLGLYSRISLSPFSISTFLYSLRWSSMQKQRPNKVSHWYFVHSHVYSIWIKRREFIWNVTVQLWVWHLYLVYFWLPSFINWHLVCQQGQMWEYFLQMSFFVQYGFPMPLRTFNLGLQITPVEILLFPGCWFYCRRLPPCIWVTLWIWSAAKNMTKLKAVCLCAQGV